MTILSSFITEELTNILRQQNLYLYGTWKYLLTQCVRIKTKYNKLNLRFRVSSGKKIIVAKLKLATDRIIDTQQ
jgi:hypothetical protein